MAVMTSISNSASGLLYPSDLMEKLRARDPEFLALQFRQINPVLIRMLAANGIYNEAAEDIAHQAWERFFLNLEKFEGRSELQTFLCGILINKIREYRRAQKRTVLEEDAEAVFAGSFTSEGWWNVKSHDPFKALGNNQLSKMIQECLEGLTDQQKAAFVLKEVEQEDSDSVCNVLGVSVSNLRVLIFRAKDKLRKCIGGKVEIADEFR